MPVQDDFLGSDAVVVAVHHVFIVLLHHPLCLVPHVRHLLRRCLHLHLHWVLTLARNYLAALEHFRLVGLRRTRALADALVITAKGVILLSAILELEEILLLNGLHFVLLDLRRDFRLHGLLDHGTRGGHRRRFLLEVVLHLGLERLGLALGRVILGDRLQLLDWVLVHLRLGELGGLFHHH